MVNAHRGIFEQCAKDLNDPASGNEVETGLDQIGTLIDVPRLPKEDNTAFINRLKPVFGDIHAEGESEVQ